MRHVADFVSHAAVVGASRVTGPRESNRHGITGLTQELLQAMDTANRLEFAPPLPKNIIDADRATTYRVI